MQMPANVVKTIKNVLFFDYEICNSIKCFFASFDKYIKTAQYYLCKKDKS